MQMAKEPAKFKKDISEKCSGCGRCIADCSLLREIGEDIISLALRGPRVEEAYSCSLCGLCAEVCPENLNPSELFKEARKQAVDLGLIDTNDFNYLLPDRPYNVLAAYREAFAVTYEGLKLDTESTEAFFPGCTLLTYSPLLTKGLYCELKKLYPEITVISDCCGLPLYQLGLEQRGADYVRNLLRKLDRLQVRQLVIACPNCYYQLQPLLATKQIQALTIYQALADSSWKPPIKPEEAEVVTIHDSCPDRHRGIFASQAREALERKGFRIVEMEHHKEQTMCCGSGGQISHTRPDLAEELIKCRLAEANACGASILAGYCLGCVLNLARIPNNTQLKIRHVLNLLTGLDEDYSQVKAQAKKLLDGPEGEKLWQKVEGKADELSRNG
jgi:fumarate reductase (CoM/CoB) subunit B